MIWGQLEQLLREIPSPSLEIYGDVNGEPHIPPKEVSQQATSFQMTVAAQVQHVAELARALDTAALGLNTLVTEDSIPELSSNGMLIEELPEDSVDTTSGPSSSAALEAILVVALYAPDATLPRPWAIELGIINSLLDALAAKHGCQPSTLLLTALPSLTRALRPILLAPAAHAASETSRLETYSGPGPWQRCLAASQTTWIARQLRPEELTPEALHLLYPLVDAAAIDASPAVQFHALWGLRHIAATALPDTFGSYAGVATRTVRRVVIGCDVRAWPAAAAAAVQLALVLDSGSPYNPHVVSLFEALLEEGQRHAYDSARSAIWLQHAPRLFLPFGLQLVRYFSSLMPLLLEWSLSPRKDLRRGGLHALLHAVHAAWPRMPAHAMTLWRVVDRVYDGEVLLAGKPSAEVVAAAKEVGVALWRCGGGEFRAAVLESKQAGEGEEGKSTGGAAGTLLDSVLAAGKERQQPELQTL